VRLQRLNAKKYYFANIARYSEDKMAHIKIEIDTESNDHKSGQRLLTPSPKNKIGIVSSIKYTPELKKAFEAGVNNNQILKNSDDNKDYKRHDTSALNASISNFLGRADLIVTVGGSIAYDAAVATIPLTDNPATQMHFLSLLGAVPGNAPDSFWGGVSLESYTSNADRIGLLTTAVGNQALVGLLRNKNSSMVDDEAFAWNGVTGNNNYYYAGTDASDKNDGSVAAFSSGFAAATAAGMKGLVVSADPHFQNSRDNFVSAANAWLLADGTRYICYPSLNFNDASTPPKGTQSILYGPHLLHAYNLLGQLAAAALNSQTAMPVLRMSNTLVRL
jgi:hypothetical protein